MDYYIEFNLIQQAEVASPVIMSMVFSKLHLILVTLSNNIGLSFPDFVKASEEGKSKLGERVRLHGDENALNCVLTHSTIKELSDYVLFSSVLKVPNEVSHFACFTRRHIKSQRDLLRKQAFLQKKSGGEWNDSAKESMQRFLDKQKCKLPFVYIISYSSKSISGNGKNHFRLFIDKYEAEQRVGRFNKYGLSESVNYASVPMF